MPPKSKGKGKGAAAAHQPKSLNMRVQQVQQQQQRPADNEQQDEQQQQQQLMVPVQMAFTSLLCSQWGLRRSSAFCMVESFGAAAPLWRDSFCLSLNSTGLSPPLHKYLNPQDARLPSEQLLVQLWQESRFRERLQLGHRLVQECGDITGAAMLLFDIAPAHNPKDWATRIQLACASYRHAWLARAADSDIAPRSMQEGDLSLQDVRWLRAQWLLARTLCGAMYTSQRRTSRLLSMVVSALVSFAPEDPMGTRFMVQRGLAGIGAYNNLDDATQPSRQPLPTGLHDLPPNAFSLDVSSMATAYNRTLACYFRYGPSADETVEALQAALALDPTRWVPLLLSGGALGVAGLPPLVALGSKEEASAYCREFGLCWWAGYLSASAMQDLAEDGILEQPPSVTWLMRRAGLNQLAAIAAADMSVAGVVLFNAGLPSSAISCVLAPVVEEMNVRLNGSMAIGSLKSTKPETCPSLARSCLVMLSCVASSTHNLPPLGTCDLRLWGPTMRNLSLPKNLEEPVSALKLRLSDTATLMWDIAQKLLVQCQLWQQQEQRRELAGHMYLLWPSELQHWAHTLDELRPARIRLLWQTGLVRTAKDAAVELAGQQQQLHAKLTAQLSSTQPDARQAALAAILRGSATAPGPVLFSLTALQEMQDFLNQQAMEAARRTLSSKTRGGRGAGSSSSGSSTGGASAKAGLVEVQYPRYEEGTAAALQRFTAAILEVAGGAGAIQAALEIGQLLRVYRVREGADSSDEDGRTESEEEEDEVDEGPGPVTRRRAKLSIAVIEQLLTAPPTPAGARQGAGSSRSSGGGGGGVTSVAAMLRASLHAELHTWRGVMGEGLARGSSGCCSKGMCSHHMENIQAVLNDPVLMQEVMRVAAAVTRDADGGQEVDISSLLEQLPVLAKEGPTAGTGAGSSGGSWAGDGGGSSNSSSGDERQVRQRRMTAVQQQQQQGSAGGGVKTTSAAGGRAGAVASAGASSSRSSGNTAAAGATAWDPAAPFGRAARTTADPGPSYVFGSSPPEAAEAAATAAFDSVLRSHGSPAQPPAAAAAGSSSGGKQGMVAAGGGGDGAAAAAAAAADLAPGGTAAASATAEGGAASAVGDPGRLRPALRSQQQQQQQQRGQRRLPTRCAPAVAAALASCTAAVAVQQWGW